jgi:magnesium transporter
MIDIFGYDTAQHTLRLDLTPGDLAGCLVDEDLLLWVDFTAPTAEETALLSSVFRLDELAIEDCTHTRQSPKLESFADYHFFIVHGIRPPQGRMDFIPVELDGFLGDRYLITYHDDGDIPAILTAKRHIQQHNSRFSMGTAYLAYQILDQIIDMFLPALDYYESRIADIEQQSIDRPFGDDSAREYMALSTQLLTLRRISVKNREVFYQFSHSPLEFIDQDEARQFRDIYDHVVRVVDMTEYYQQTLRGVLEIQYSLSSNRMNQVVQFLTVFATIMLPLNVITGIYGMNFTGMPFLTNPWGFWAVVLLMGVMVLLMLRYFRRRQWI